MTPFDFDPSIRVIFGAGTLGQLGDLASALAGPRALLVTDPGLVQAGLAEQAQHALQNAGLTTTLFASVAENPTTEHVAAGVHHARAHGPIDLIVALGGGSAMDCAKGINFLLTNGGQMQDYRGYGKTTQPMLPSIGIPTTAGTGSEAQSYALITCADTRAKMACGDRRARFCIAVLDPNLLASTPQHVRADAGMDALSHAVESYVSTRGTPLSQMFAGQAWCLLAPHYEATVADPQNAAAAMLLGAHLAGTAIENSMLGAAHATANPLTARYPLSHGRAVALMLPHVIRLNAPAVDELYGELCAKIQLNGRALALAAHLEELRAVAGLPRRLADCQVAASDLPAMGREAAGQWTGTFNPIPLQEADFLRLYETAF